ncbi:MAG: hypothetical protein ACTS6A_02450 [Candidatus Hodgkinia cicadicola]
MKYEFHESLMAEHETKLRKSGTCRRSPGGSPIMIGNGKVASFCGRQIWGERLGQLRYCAGALESWEASTGDERARRGRKRNAMWTKVENDITKLHFGEVIKTDNEGLRWWLVQRSCQVPRLRRKNLALTRRRLFERCCEVY